MSTVRRTYKATATPFGYGNTYLTECNRDEFNPNLELIWDKDGKLLDAVVLEPWVDYADKQPSEGERIHVETDDGTIGLWYYHQHEENNTHIRRWRVAP